MFLCGDPLVDSTPHKLLGHCRALSVDEQKQAGEPVLLTRPGVHDLLIDTWAAAVGFVPSPKTDMMRGYGAVLQEHAHRLVTVTRSRSRKDNRYMQEAEAVTAGASAGRRHCELRPAHARSGPPGCSAPLLQPLQCSPVLHNIFNILQLNLARYTPVVTASDSESEMHQGSAALGLSEGNNMYSEGSEA